MPFLATHARRFRDQQSGAVTAEYLPFIGGIIGIGLVVAVTVSSGTQDVSAEVSDRLSNATVDLGTSQTLSGNGAKGNTLSSKDVGGDPLKNVSDTTQANDAASDEGAEHAATGPAASQPGSGASGGPGNPGNDKTVGNAGENPSGASNPGSTGNGQTGNAGGSSSAPSGGSSSGGSGGSGGASLPTSEFGNPGNDKDVGKAGENPNGDPNWGGPTAGKSDAENQNDSAQQVAGNGTGTVSSSDSDDDDDKKKDRKKDKKKDKKDKKDKD